MSGIGNPRQNRILATLPAADYERLLPKLELVALPLGMVLDASGEKWKYIYFPTNSVVSLLYMTQDGKLSEIAITGCEGLVGVELFMGGESSPRRAVVTSAGSGYRIEAASVKNEIAKGGPLMQLALLYTQALITQMELTAVCNRHHTIQQQLCRWLLMSLDRLPSSELKMTQVLIANMLGVRREGISEAAKPLKGRGVIKCRRGRISVLDRATLEEYACGCYAVVKGEYDRLLNHTAPRICQQMSTLPRSTPAITGETRGWRTPVTHERHDGGLST